VGRLIQTAGKRKGLPYREGDWFAVPLRDGDWAVGIVARKKPRARIVLGYFFGPRRKTLPCLDDLSRLTAAEADWISIFSANGIVRGDWPVIGQHPAWDRTAWPMPAFGYRLPLVDLCVRREYPDDDPQALFVRQTPISPEECARLPEDGTSFVGAVEIRLTLLFPKAGPPPYREGDWFALPLPEGGWVLGRIARVPPAGTTLFGYLFGPRRAEPPTLADAVGLTPDDAIHYDRFSDLDLRSIRKDRCPILGQDGDWDRSQWPVPPFAEFDRTTKQWSLVRCDDDDPGGVVERLLLLGEQRGDLPMHNPTSLDGIARTLDVRREREERQMRHQKRRPAHQSRYGRLKH
jgi:hypothetical protein